MSAVSLGHQAEAELKAWLSSPSSFYFRSVVSRISFFAARFSCGVRGEGGASYCLVSGRQALRILYFRSGLRRRCRIGRHLENKTEGLTKRKKVARARQAKLHPAES